MGKDRLFKREYSQKLMRVAAMDLLAGKSLHQVHHPRPENILFHAQQCVEKSLKSLLCWIQKPIPQVLDIQLLCERISSYAEVPAREDLAELSQFAAIRRYEEGDMILSDQEVQDALDLAERTYQWVIEQISNKDA